MNNGENKKEYEISFLLEKEEDSLILDEKMNSLGLEITENGELKKIFLAYPINKKTEAFFGFRRFLASPQEIENFSSELGIEKEILRFLIVTVSPLQKDGKEKITPSLEKKIPSKAKEEVTATAKVRTITNEELEEKLKEILN